MTRYPAIRAAFVLAAALPLVGCGALLGGGKPAQLYRFGAPPAAMPANADVAPVARRVVLLAPIRFAAEVEGDRVLASRGGEMLYIKGIRWIAPAPTLFAQAVSSGFRTRAPGIDIVDRAAGRVAGATLQITIDRFEARYPTDPAEAPTITIEGQAMLIDPASRLPTDRYRLMATRRADRNGTAAITAAFDQVTETAVSGLVDWANQASTSR